MLNTFKSIQPSCKIKILGIISLFFIICSLYIISITPSAIGYELSIYDQYPFYIWIFFIASLICSILILSYQSFFLEKETRWWSIGLFLFIFTNIIILLLPLIRGYFLASSFDEVCHLGHWKDIYETGYLGINNFYPLSHILASQINHISKININSIFRIIPITFYILYIISLYLLAKTIGNAKQALLIMAFSSVLLFTYFHYMFMPTQIFLYFIPLILFLMIKRDFSKKIEYSIIFMIILVAVPFIHPLGAIFLIIILLIFQFTIYLKKLLINRGFISKNFKIKNKKTLVPSLFIFVIFFSWFSVFALFRSTVNKAFMWFVEGYGNPPVEVISERLSSSGISIIDIINIIMNRYGVSLIITLLALFSIFIILKKFKEKKEFNTIEVFFSIFFISFAIFYIQTLFGDFIITGQSLRIYCWPLAAATILNGLILRDWVSNLKERNYKIVSGLITLIIIISAIFGVYTVFPSPIIKQANPMVTNTEPSGMEWLLENKDHGRTNYISSFPFTARYLIYGYDGEKPKHIKITPMVSHFGYNTTNFAINTFEYGDYLVITNFDKEFYTKLWPVEGRFNQSDFIKLYSDASINKIYFNGELETWIL